MNSNANSMICKQDQLRILVLFAIVLPPLSAYLLHGCGPKFFLNLALSALFYLPGAFHALYLISSIKNSTELPH